MVFAIKPRDYSYTTPKKIRRLALKSVLTSRVREDRFTVLDDLKLDSYSTKEAAKVLEAIKADKKALIVVKDASPETIGSFKNIPSVQTISVDEMNVYDLVRFESLIMTQDAVKKAEEVFQ